MDLHVVRPVTASTDLSAYGVSMDRLLQDNQLPDPSQLVVGQVILVRYPALTHVVKSGDTLYSIARTIKPPGPLLQNNPGLQGRTGSFPVRLWSSAIRTPEGPRG